MKSVDVADVKKLLADVRSSIRCARKHRNETKSYEGKHSAKGRLAAYTTIADRLVILIQDSNER